VRQFKYSGWHAPDVVQTLDGQVWVSIIPPSPGLWNSWVEVERIQSESFDRSRDTQDNPFGGFGTRTGRSSGYSFLRDDRKPESKYGVRDHRPMSEAEQAQVRMYVQAAGYTADPDIIRNLFGK